MEPLRRSGHRAEARDTAVGGHAGGAVQVDPVPGGQLLDGTRVGRGGEPGCARLAGPDRPGQLREDLVVAVVEAGKRRGSGCVTTDFATTEHRHLAGQPVAHGEHREHVLRPAADDVALVADDVVDRDPESRAAGRRCAGRRRYPTVRSPAIARAEFPWSTALLRCSVGDRALEIGEGDLVAGRQHPPRRRRWASRTADWRWPVAPAGTDRRPRRSRSRRRVHPAAGRHNPPCPARAGWHTAARPASGSRPHRRRRRRRP